MKRALLALLLLCGCVEEPVDDGTAVGNPSLTTFAIAAGEGFTIEAASAPVASVRYTACDESTVAEDVDRPIDLLGGTLELRAGTWCALLVDFSGPVSASAAWTDGGDPATLDLTLAPGTLGFAPDGGALLLDDDALLLELAAPGWLDAIALGLQPGEDRVVDEDSAEHDALAGAIEEDSTLFEDVDEDGVLAAADRERPVAAIGEPSFEHPDAAPAGYSQEACGCTAAGGFSSPLGLVALLGLLSRRRRGGRAPRR